MTKNIIDRAIQKSKIPKDELDKTTDNVLGTGTVIFIGIIAMVGAIINLALQPKYHPSHEFLFVIIGAVIVVTYTIWSKLNERNLHSLRMNKSIRKKELKQIGKLHDWELINSGSELLMFYVQYGISTNKLTIILRNNYLYYNIRMIGSWQGRLPHLCGFEFLHRNRVRKIINDYMQHAANGE